MAAPSSSSASSARVALAALVTSVSLSACAASHPPANAPGVSAATASAVSTTPAAAAPLPEIVFDVVPPDSTLDAVGTSVIGRHEAWLERFRGTVTFVPADVTRSHVEIDLDMTSLTMRLPALTRAIRSKRFFDVERFPHARFVSTAIATTDKPDVYRVTGDLEMHGRQKRVTFVATVVRGEGWATARGEVRLDRHDFGLTDDGPLDRLADRLLLVQIWAQGSPR